MTIQTDYILGVFLDVSNKRRHLIKSDLDIAIRLKQILLDCIDEFSHSLLDYELKIKANIMTLLVEINRYYHDTYDAFSSMETVVKKRIQLFKDE